MGDVYGRLVALAGSMARGCSDKFHQRYISVEEDIVAEKSFTDPFGCNCNMAREALALAEEVRAAAFDLREDGDPTCVYDVAERLARAEGQPTSSGAE